MGKTSGSRMDHQMNVASESLWRSSRCYRTSVPGGARLFHLVEAIACRASGEAGTLSSCHDPVFHGMLHRLLHTV